jgi:hypothetical protein
MISKSRTDGGKTYKDGATFEEFFNHVNVGDAISGFFESEFEHKDKFKPTEKKEAIILHECECEIFDENGEITSDECKSEMAVSWAKDSHLAKVMKTIKKKLPNHEFESNHVLTFTLYELEDTGKGNPMKKISVTVNSGTRANLDDIPFG